MMKISVSTRRGDIAALQIIQNKNITSITTDSTNNLFVKFDGGEAVFNSTEWLAYTREVGY